MGGVYTGSITYQAIADGNPHTYRFYTLGTDAEGNVEAPPTDPGQDIVLTAAFAAPSQLAVTAFEVQRGMAQRSFVRYLDVTFNLTDALNDLVATLGDADPTNDRVCLLRYNLDGTGPGTAVSLESKIQVADHVLLLDFGPEGIGGNRSSNLGGGYYQLTFDLDGNGAA